MNNTISVLGASTSLDKENSNTSIKINEKIIIDAGNIIKPLDKTISLVQHIFISNVQLNNISELGLLLENTYNTRTHSLKIYATKTSIQNLRTHYFNNIIWPNYEKINLFNSDKPSIQYIQIQYDETIILDDICIKAIKNNHQEGSCAYVIEKNSLAILFTSSTGKSDNIINEINTNKKIHSVIIECSFPRSFEELAKKCNHHTSKTLSGDLKNIKRDNVKLYINHIKTTYIKQIKKEIKDNLIPFNGGKFLQSGDIISFDPNSKITNSKHTNKKDINQLIDIGQSLTSEKNFDALMEKILLAAISISNADAGTLYLMNEDETQLQFKVVQTNSLDIQMGGTKGEITWPPLNLYKKNGQKNKEMVAALCASDNKLFNIEDVYTHKDFNFEGAKEFDLKTKYRTKSMLVVPMIDHDDNVIGVLQLLNKTNEVNLSSSFTLWDEKIIKSVSSQAAIAITNIRLIDDLEKLLDSFIKSIAQAIDEKSPYTGGHIKRVAQLAMMMIEAIDEDQSIYKNKNYSINEKKEIRIAAWMHDIGKISTPEYIVDKSKKLETIFNRIDFVETKFEILKLQKENQILRELLSSEKIDTTQVNKKINEFKNKLQEEFIFIKQINSGSEFMKNEDILKIEEISKKEVLINDKNEALINQNEVYNLCIKKGTLTKEEREIINKHSLISIQMLNALPYPKKFKRIPKIAGAHHEKIAGGGYPFNLKGDQIIFEARILAIADIFEALTSHDRPYKDANSLNQAMKILSSLVQEGHLDKDLVKFFVDKKLHLQYAKENLKESQIDDVTVNFNSL